MERAFLVCWALNSYLDHVIEDCTCDECEDEEDRLDLHLDEADFSSFLLCRGMGGSYKVKERIPPQPMIQTTLEELLLPEMGEQLFLERLVETLRNPGTLFGLGSLSAFRVACVAIMACPTLLLKTEISDVFDAMFEAIERLQSSDIPGNAYFVMQDLMSACLYVCHSANFAPSTQTFSFCSAMMPRHSANGESLRAMMSITREGRVFDVLCRALRGCISEEKTGSRDVKLYGRLPDHICS